MLLHWKVRYWDRSCREMKDRSLVLDTETLDPATKEAVELVADEEWPNRSERILKFRQLFVECDHATLSAMMRSCAQFRGVGPHEYFEDDDGRPVTLHELGPLLTGNPDVVFIPSGARPHDIELMLSKSDPLDVTTPLAASAARHFAYFARDLRELERSAFIKEGPGILQSSNLSSEACVLETAVSEEEIRSFLTIFRRFYMSSEPFNFDRTADLFVQIHGDHPRSRWVGAVRNGFLDSLEKPIDSCPFWTDESPLFTTKRIIDVFLYTRFAHQPDERRERQYRECLRQVSGKKSVLTWIFLFEVSGCSLEILNAGRVITAWFSRYCRTHGMSPDVLNSLSEDHAGVGSLEKEDARSARKLQERIDALAFSLWQHEGCPVGGFAAFIPQAKDQLGKLLGSA